MAKITEIQVTDVYSKDLNQQQWTWKGICVCGEECEDTENGEVKKILVNIAISVCNACYSAAQD